MIYVIIGIIAIIVVLITLIVLKIKKLKELEEVLNICENNIREILNNKKELLDKVARDAKQKKLINDLKVEDIIECFVEEEVER